MLMVANKRASLGRSAVHPVLRHSFVHSVFRSFVRSLVLSVAERSVDHLIVVSVIRLSRFVVCSDGLPLGARLCVCLRFWFIQLFLRLPSSLRGSWA